MGASTSISWLKRGSKSGLNRTEIEENDLVTEEDTVEGNSVVSFWTSNQLTGFNPWIRVLKRWHCKEWGNRASSGRSGHIIALHRNFSLRFFFFLDTPQIKPDGWFSVISTDKTNMHPASYNRANFPYAYDSVEPYPVLLCIISLMGKGWRHRSFLSFQKPLQETIKTRTSPIPPVHCTNLSY